jgi:tetratricopeptide (TPR) repeat protein
MEDRLILRRQRQEREQEYRDLAAKSCYSVIVIILALVILRPLMVDQILSRADAYCAVGRLDESQRQCNKALLIDDDCSQAWRQLARNYKIQGDREMAYAAYEKAIGADSTNRSAHFDLGMMYMDDGRFPLAIPHFEQVRRLGAEKTKAGQICQESYHRAALHMLLLCYEKVGDLVKTELALKEIRVFYPDFKREAEPQKSLSQSNPAR